MQARAAAAAATLVLVILLAGCTGTGAEVEPRAPLPKRPAAPPLPEGVTLEGATLLGRNATGAAFLWEGVANAGGLGVPALGARVEETLASAELSLPADVPVRVEARLRWNGTADLDLFVDEGDARRCFSATPGGGTLADVAGEEACVAHAEAGPARAWTIEAVNVDGAARDVPFQVTVTVETYASAPRYDLAAGPAPRAIAPDPTIPGPGEVVTAEYDFGVLLVEDRVTKRPWPVRVLGVVHHPAEGEGPWPVVVFLHGRSGWCKGPYQAAFLLSHCRGPEPVGGNVPSHRGYDEDARLLASHGYVVASIDANDVNALDSPRRGVPNGDDGIDARAKLILRTLDDLRAVHERGGSPSNPNLDPLKGRLDLARVGLMGHSRGAEGVTRTPAYAHETGHWSADALLAVYSLAGTTRPHLPDYLMPTVRGPTAYAAVSPYCDGDIWNLGNLDYYDAFRLDPQRGPLVHLLFMGSNHNYYNAEWTDDDAAGTWRADGYCGPDGAGYGRLMREDQARHQRAYLPAYFRLHLGGETAFEPLFTGMAAPPESACPTGLNQCPGLVHVSAQPAPERARGIEDAAGDDALRSNDLGGASAFTGFARATWCDPLAAPTDDPCAYGRVSGIAPRLHLAWTTDATWRTTIPQDAEDWRAYDTLALRIGVDFDDHAPPGGWPPHLTLVLEDDTGRRATATAAEHTAALFAPPGDASRRVVLNQARIPLDAFQGIDLARVAAVELRFSGATPGAIHVADLAAMDLQ